MSDPSPTPDTAAPATGMVHVQLPSDWRDTVFQFVEQYEDARNIAEWLDACGADLTDEDAVARSVAGTAAPVLCCDLHGIHCEPPSELCCEQCTEVRHPAHPAGVACVLPATGLCHGCDLSGVPVQASDDGRGQFCGRCLPVANEAGSGTAALTEDPELINMAQRMAAALSLAIHDGHPAYGNTTGWRGGIGGQAITQGCSFIDPPPGVEYTQHDLLSTPLREFLTARPFDLNQVKAALREELEAQVHQPRAGDGDE